MSGASAQWPSVSVVIPARNAESVIEGQLSALVQQDYPGEWEVVVADNGSTDATGQVTRQWMEKLPNLRLVDAGHAPGINVARNAGVQASSGELVLLCDSDDRVAFGWIEAMADAFRSGARILGGELNRIGEHVQDGEQPLGQLSEGLADSLGFLPWAQGANCGFARSVHQAVGGFDETFRGGGDETDFFWKAQLAGHQLYFVPDAVVHYLVRGDDKSLFRQNYDYGRSHVKLFRRFGDDGMPRPSIASVGRRLARMGRDAVMAFHPPHRRSLVKSIAITAGHAQASLQYRTLFP